MQQPHLLHKCLLPCSSLSCWMLSIFAMLSPSECRNLAVAAQLMPRNGLTAGRSSYISSYCNASPLHPNINHSRRNWQSTLCSRVRTSLKKKTQRKSIGTGRLVMEPSTLPRPGKRLIVACDGEEPLILLTTDWLTTTCRDMDGRNDLGLIASQLRLLGSLLLIGRGIG